MIIKIQDIYYKLLDLQGKEITDKNIVDKLLLIKETLNYAKDNIDDPYASISYNPIEAYEDILSEFNMDIKFTEVKSEDYIEL